MRKGLRSDNSPLEQNHVLRQSEDNEKPNIADLNTALRDGSESGKEVPDMEAEHKCDGSRQEEECGEHADECNTPVPGKKNKAGNNKTSIVNDAEKKANGDGDVVVRVLRSRFVTKSEGKKKGKDGAVENTWDGKRREGNEAENDSGEDEIEHNLIEKITTGTDEPEKESDDCLKASQVKKELNKKRGRPSKVQHSNCLVKNEDKPGNLSGRKLKRKRGRPPKVQISNVFAENASEGGNEDSLHDGGFVRFEKDLTEKDAEGVLVEKRTRGSEVSEKERAKSDKPTSILRVKRKRKRGRPPKVRDINGVPEKEEEGGIEDDLVDQIRQNNRIENLEVEETEDAVSRKKSKGSEYSVKERVEKKYDESGKPMALLRKKEKRKRGRPPKLQGNNGAVKEMFDKEEPMARAGKSKKGSDLMMSSLAKRIGRLKRKGTRPSPKLSPKTKKGFGLVKNTGKKSVETTEDGYGGMPRRTAKQMVRDKIVDLLLKAGWWIDYRQRIGREYNDAVYVNPDGRTHWSVTLAYNKLKEEYEDGNGNLEATENGFVFTPIPEEEISLLNRVTVKKRSDKGKQKHKGGAGKNKADDVVKNRKNKQGSTAVTSHKKLPILVRKHGQEKMDGRKRCSLRARKSNEGAESNGDDYVPYRGKRTLLAWMIDSGTVPLNVKVRCMSQRKKKVLLEGRITRDGIYCNCCNEICTLSEFVMHAGDKFCQPYQNMYLEAGVPLLNCQLETWKKEEECDRRWFHLVDVEGEDPNDDTCGICGDGGDLICCDGCPSTFHQSCLDIQEFPPGEWNCVYCTCKFCGTVGANACRQSENNSDVTASSLCACRLCEEKYHKECVEKGAVKVDLVGPSFCGEKCLQIFERLQTLLGIKNELEEGFSWTLIQRTDVGSDASLHETQKNLECNLKLAVALSVMDECFCPLVDHKSGVNLIRNIVYSCGSNVTRLNFTGFYTAILERDDEIIAAACIRIHGNHLVEMPFIGTRYMYRRQGMCRRLLSAIETALCLLDIEKLVIPAVSDLRETWTSIFGFKPLENPSKLKMRSMNMMVFPGTDMLQKSLLDNGLAERSVNPSEGLTSTQLQCATVHDGIHAAVESNLKPLDGLSSHTSESSETIDILECETERNIIVGADDLIAENKTVLNHSASACDAFELDKDIGRQEKLNSAPILAALSDTKLDLDSQASRCNLSLVEKKSSVELLVGTETTSCGEILPASRGGTDCVASEVQRGRIDTIRNSEENGFAQNSVAVNITQCEDASAVSTPKSSTQSAGGASVASHHGKDTNSQNSEQWVTGCTPQWDGGMLDGHKGKDNKYETKKLAKGPVHPASTADHCKSLPVGYNQSDHGTGATSASVDSSCHPSDGSTSIIEKPELPYCPGGGQSKSKDVTLESCNFTGDGAHESNGSNVAPMNSGSCDRLLIADGTRIRTSSSQLSEFNSEVDLKCT